MRVPARTRIVAQRQEGQRFESEEREDRPHSPPFRTSAKVRYVKSRLTGKAAAGNAYNVADMASLLQAVRNAGANNVVILGAWPHASNPRIPFAPNSPPVVQRAAKTPQNSGPRTQIVKKIDLRWETP